MSRQPPTTMSHAEAQRTQRRIHITTETRHGEQQMSKTAPMTQISSLTWSSSCNSPCPPCLRGEIPIPCDLRAPARNSYNNSNGPRTTEFPMADNTKPTPPAPSNRAAPQPPPASASPPSTSAPTRSGSSSPKSSPRAVTASSTKNARTPASPPRSPRPTDSIPKPPTPPSPSFATSSPSRTATT